MPFTTQFYVRTFFPSAPVAPIVICLTGDCSAMLSLTTLNIGTAPIPTAWGFIPNGSTSGIIVVPSSSYDELCRCLAHPGVRLNITYTLTPTGDMVVCGLATDNNGRVPFEVVAADVRSLAKSNDQIKDALSGHVLSELMKLNHTMSDVLKLLQHNAGLMSVGSAHEVAHNGREGDLT